MAVEIISSNPFNSKTELSSYELGIKNVIALIFSRYYTK